MWTDAAEAVQQSVKQLGAAADTSGYSDTYYLWIYFGLGAASIALQVSALGSIGSLDFTLVGTPKGICGACMVRAVWVCMLWAYIQG